MTLWCSQVINYPANMSYGEYNTEEVSDQFQDGLNLDGRRREGGYGGGDGGDYEGAALYCVCAGSVRQWQVINPGFHRLLAWNCCCHVVFCVGDAAWPKCQIALEPQVKIADVHSVQQ